VIESLCRVDADVEELGLREGDYLVIRSGSAMVIRELEAADLAALANHSHQLCPADPHQTDVRSLLLRAQLRLEAPSAAASAGAG
jgi:hypothetical protein